MEEILWSALESACSVSRSAAVWTAVALAHYYQVNIKHIFIFLNKAYVVGCHVSDLYLQYTRGRLDQATAVLGWMRRYHTWADRAAIIGN